MGQIGIGVLGVKHGLDICFSVGGIVREKKVIIFFIWCWACYCCIVFEYVTVACCFLRCILFTEGFADSRTTGSSLLSIIKTWASQYPPKFLDLPIHLQCSLTSLDIPLILRQKGMCVFDRAFWVSFFRFCQKLVPFMVEAKATRVDVTCMIGVFMFEGLLLCDVWELYFKIVFIKIILKKFSEIKICFCIGL